MKPRIILIPRLPVGVKHCLEVLGRHLARSPSQAFLGSNSATKVIDLSLAEPTGALSGAVSQREITPSGFWGKIRPEPFLRRGWLLSGSEFIEITGHYAATVANAQEVHHG